MIQRFDRVLLMLTFAAVLCNIATWSLLLWKIPQTSETIFLHYNVYFGVDLTGGWRQLFWVPGSGTVILLVNTLVILLDAHMHRIARVMMGVLTIGFQMMLLVASVLIILLNTT
jgi:hypothetical protein